MLQYSVHCIIHRLLFPLCMCMDVWIISHIASYMMQLDWMLKSQCICWWLKITMFSLINGYNYIVISLWWVFSFIVASYIGALKHACTGIIMLSTVTKSASWLAMNSSDWSSHIYHRRNTLPLWTFFKQWNASILLKDLTINGLPWQHRAGVCWPMLWDILSVLMFIHHFDLSIHLCNPPSHCQNSAIPPHSCYPTAINPLSQNHDSVIPHP